MNKTLLIFKHEFTTTLKRTGFIILTLALPVLALLAIGIIQLVSATVKPPTTATITSIGYVDEEGGFNQFTAENNIKLVPFQSTKTALQAMDSGNVSDYFVIPADYSTKGIIENYTLEKQISVPTNVQSTIQNFLTSNLLANKVQAATIQIIESPLNIVNTRLTTQVRHRRNKEDSRYYRSWLFDFLLAFPSFFHQLTCYKGLEKKKKTALWRFYCLQFRHGK